MGCTESHTELCRGCPLHHRRHASHPHVCAFRLLVWNGGGSGIFCGECSCRTNITGQDCNSRPIHWEDSALWGVCQGQERQSTAAWAPRPASWAKLTPLWGVWEATRVQPWPLPRAQQWEAIQKGHRQGMCEKLQISRISKALHLWGSEQGFPGYAESPPASGHTQRDKATEQLSVCRALSSWKKSVQVQRVWETV